MVSISVNGELKVGRLVAHTTSGRGLTPEEITARLMEKLLYVSRDTPEPLRQQVEAFRDSMHRLILRAMQQAVRSERTTIYNLLLNNGHATMAQSIVDWKG